MANQRVLVFGTFDLLHEGHKQFLRMAKTYGKELVVVIARDMTVHRVKNRRPLHDESYRKEQVGKLPFVDKVVLGNLDDVYKIIEELSPDIICLGYDQTHFTDALDHKLQEFGLTTKIIRIPPFEEHRYKTSLLRKTIHEP